MLHARDIRLRDEALESSAAGAADVSIEDNIPGEPSTSVGVRVFLGDEKPGSWDGPDYPVTQIFA